MYEFIHTYKEFIQNMYAKYSFNQQAKKFPLTPKLNVCSPPPLTHSNETFIIS